MGEKISLMSLELISGARGRRVYATVEIHGRRARGLVYHDRDGRAQVKGLERYYPLLDPPALELMGHLTKGEE